MLTAGLTGGQASAGVSMHCSKERMLRWSNISLITAAASMLGKQLCPLGRYMLG